MIIDSHTHFTTAPAQLQAYRGQQITNLAKPVRASLRSATRRSRARWRASSNACRIAASTG